MDEQTTPQTPEKPKKEKKGKKRTRRIILVIVLLLLLLLGGIFAYRHFVGSIPDKGLFAVQFLEQFLTGCRVDTQRTYGFDDSRRFTLFVYRQYLVSIFLVLTVHFFQLIGQLFNDIPVVGGIYAETPLELVFVVVDEQTIQ